MATIKALIDDFTDRINQPREASYATGTTPAARQFVSLFRRIGEKLLANPNGWPQLKTTYTFTISTGVSNYQLPGDYSRMCTGTQWGVTNQIQLGGPLTDQSIAFQTYGIAASSPYSGYQANGAQGYVYNTSPYQQVSAGYFQLTPPGQNSTDQNVIAYYTRNWMWPTAWTTLTVYAPGAKVTGVANIYICTVGGTSGATRPSVTSGTVVDGTVTWAVYHEPYPIAADTDFCQFDDELMIEGMRWAWYQAKKQSYEDILEQWNSLVASSLGRANGNGYINAAYDADGLYEYPRTPIANWDV